MSIETCPELAKIENEIRKFVVNRAQKRLAKGDRGFAVTCQGKCEKKRCKARVNAVAINNWDVLRDNPNNDIEVTVYRSGECKEG